MSSQPTRRTFWEGTPTSSSTALPDLSIYIHSPIISLNILRLHLHLILRKEHKLLRLIRIPKPHSLLIPRIKHNPFNFLIDTDREFVFPRVEEVFDFELFDEGVVWALLINELGLLD